MHFGAVVSLKSTHFVWDASHAVGVEEVPFTPIDQETVQQYQSVLRRKFEDVRYTTTVRRPEDVMDIAAVWGYVRVFGVWSSRH